MKYVVTYEETLSRTFIVDADSYNDAEEKMLNAIGCGDVELTANDYLYDSGCISYIDKACEDDENYYCNLDKFTK